jgi:hypothetical protein
VAAFYADENFAEGVVVRLRRLGHDVLTAHEADRANQGIPATVRGCASLPGTLLRVNRPA